jgi:sugar phosphate isomerase/epimerase
MILFKTAISSKVLQGLPLPNIIEYAARLGFDGIELWMHQLAGCGWSLKQIKECLQKHYLCCQVHAETRDTNLASTNPGIRAESLRQAAYAIQCARDLDASVITIHPGRLTSQKDLCTRDHLWDLQVKAFDELAVLAGKAGLVIGIENMEARDKEFVVGEEHLARIIRSIDSPHLMATLDIAHLYSTGSLYSSLDNWTLPLVNVHISQASGEMHLPIHARPPGAIDYTKVFPALARRYSGFLVVEGFQAGQEKDNARKSMEWLQSLL